MPSLLDLPPELRNKICELALIHDSPPSVEGIYPSYHGHGATATLKRSHFALTQVNRQLRRDTLPIFYSSNTFTICLQPVYVTFPGIKDGRARRFWRRTYGDHVTAQWLETLPNAAVAELKAFRVYVACVSWYTADQKKLEREKCDYYCVAGLKTTKAMTVHILYDGCSGSQLFYGVDLERKRVESFVEVFAEDDEDEGLWGGDECKVCLRVLQKWHDSVGVEGGERRVTREKLAELVWLSGLAFDRRPGYGRI